MILVYAAAPAPFRRQDRPPGVVLSVMKIGNRGRAWQTTLDFAFVKAPIATARRRQRGCPYQRA